MDKEVKRKSLFWWAFLVAIIALYDWAFTTFGFNKELFYLRESFNALSVSLFLVYWLCVLLLITSLFRNINNKKILLEIAVALLSLIILSVFWRQVWFVSLVLYYILAAFTEEMFKFTVSNNQSQRIDENKVSLLLFLAILIWLSFSISENIYAFISQLIDWDLSVGFILGRGLVASLIHCISTWAIALVLMKIKKCGLLFRYFVALLLGSLIHIFYNISIVYNLMWLVFIFVVLALIFLSYLFFNMDEIYSK